MFKKLLLIITFLLAGTAFAAVDINSASSAELDGIKGIGPGLSTKILTERKKSPFKDWADFISRVPGVGAKNATKFSSEGLRVNDKAFEGKASTTAAVPATKSTVKKTTEPTAAAPATAAPAAPTAVEAPAKK